MLSATESRFPDRPLLSTSQPIQPPPRHSEGPLTAYDSDDDDDDIYRGETLPGPASDSSSVASSSTGSSSSSSERHAGPLGALAAIVEHAVSKWARRARYGSSVGSTTSSLSSETSSSSSSSSHSTSSINTLTRTRRRLRARSSQASLQTIQSEREIIAHISRLKALEESRQIPRNFGLYLPPTLNVPGGTLGVVKEGSEDNSKRRELSTTSLSYAISHLEALTRASRGRRVRGRSKYPTQYDGSRTSSHPHTHQPSKPRQTQSRSMRFSAFAVPKKSKKGKRRGSLPAKPIPPAKNPQLMPKAWFLDVASPTWEDLRALGKLLHIHPLTLEDILQQDPREKLELFPKLGYYFVSFRAIESNPERTRMQLEARRHVDATGNDPDAVNIPIGEANVYLAVFNDGICCFHYRDISDHVDRVRNRIVMLDEVVNMSSDWIAHGIIDSIVDSFFPFLNEIEKEVMAIEDLVYTKNDDPGESPKKDARPPKLQTPSTLKAELEPEVSAKEDPGLEPEVEEKQIPKESNVSQISQDSIRPHFAAPRPTLKMLFRRFRRYIEGVWFQLRHTKHDGRSRVSPRTTTLRRMAKTRRLVTSLGRSLAGKSEVMTQIRKRLVQGGLESSLGNGGTKSEELEVAIYMGDVHDHILTLQHSLNHIERTLSQSHPSYLSQLRVAVARTKGGSDMAILYLTIVSIAILCCQGVTGTFSLNVHVPTNNNPPRHLYNVFGIVISLVCFVLTAYLITVHHWWKAAERRRGAMLRKDEYYTPADMPK